VAQPHFPMVGIGASAGGLEAISELLNSLPATSGMAFLVVQHLDPGHESSLPELLARKTRLTLGRTREGEPVLPEHLYVIPPNAIMRVADGALRLHARDTAEGRHTPIDILLRSLAQDRGQNAIGIIMSGTGSDGSRGLEEIKGAGGITFAQDESSARFSGMPRAAIETGCVDFVLEPQKIAEELARIAQHPYLQTNPKTGEEALPSAETDNFRKIFQLVRAQSGVDFSHYKHSTIQRRMVRRMALRQIEDIGDYATVLRNDPGEVQALINDFLVRVTGFFRDPESFVGLVETVFPALLERRAPNDPLRIWVPGCASGEEVYSIAISLMEFVGGRAALIPVQIFGTDLSESAIEKARAGQYTENISSEVSSERLKRFFVKLDKNYQVAKSIRDICIFARQNLAYDPPFSRLDLVSCRNVLIYFDQALQRRVIPSFHYALKPGGFLMLGPSEGGGLTGNLFHLVNSEQKIYRKQGGDRIDVERPANEMVPSASDPRSGIVSPMAVVDIERAQRETERILLTRYAPASLVIDENLNIVYFHGDTARYIEHTRGPASLNLRSVTRPGLLIELSNAIKAAREQNASVTKNVVLSNEAGVLSEIAIEVQPLKVPGGNVRYDLVLFQQVKHEIRNPEQIGWLARLLPNTLGGATPVRSGDDRRVSAQLQRELEATQSFLKATIEEYEAAKEEMKSAQEEILSSNEEFLSTNEELETAKEELQSTNEELAVTNEELRNRNSELHDTNQMLQRSRDYLEAIFETLHEAVIILDPTFRVRKANHAFYEYFQVRREDVEGHLLFELGNGQWNIPRLRTLVGEVLGKNTPIVDYEITHTFPIIGQRVLVLNACRLAGENYREEMILLAFEDISDRIGALRLSDLRKNDFLSMLAHELRNPLAPIRTSVRLLRMNGTNGKNGSHLDLIDRQVAKMVRIVDDLLDVSRFTRGNIIMQKEQIDLLKLVDQAVEASRTYLDEKRQELSVSMPADPIYVTADPVRLEQAIGNILNNAAKYTDRNGKVRLTLERTRDEAVIRISDNGVGIAPEALSDVFEIFYQADHSLDRTRGGIGVGLSLARRLVELHNGRIEVASEGLGKGSEFSIFLPVNYEPPSSSRKTSSNTSDMDSHDAHNGSRKVLIVDDNPDTIESMELLIESWGHTVLTAHNGSSAVESAGKDRPDVALIDIGLPGMNGYEVARRIRALPGMDQTLLVAVTGYGRDEDRRKALDSGFDLHLVKPLDSNRLESFLTTLKWK
jgi:two-component system, chemotaxis family, CheB/CheR fusion protein